MGNTATVISTVMTGRSSAKAERSSLPKRRLAGRDAGAATWSVLIARLLSAALSDRAAGAAGITRTPKARDAQGKKWRPHLISGAISGTRLQLVPGFRGLIERRRGCGIAKDCRLPGRTVDFVPFPEPGHDHVLLAGERLLLVQIEISEYCISRRDVRLTVV